MMEFSAGTTTTYSSLESSLMTIQELLRDEDQPDGVLIPPNVVSALKISQQIKSIIASITAINHDSNQTEMELKDVRGVFEQLQLSSAYLLSICDSRIKNQLPDLIEAVIQQILQAASSTNSWEVMIYPIAVSSLQYIVAHLSRKVVTRPTTLGSSLEIDMDDTTGWEDLEIHIKIFQAILRASYNFKDVVISLWILEVSMEKLDDPSITASGSELNPDEEKVDNEPVPAWYILLTRCAYHINRHLRENVYNFIGSLLSLRHFQVEDLFLCFTSAKDFLPSNRLVGGKIQTKWVDVVMQVLPHGLEDDWTQIRYASCLVLKELLQLLSSCKPTEGANPDIMMLEELMNTHAVSILPRLCINRFHAAPSVQNCAKQIWQTYFFSPPTALLSSISTYVPLGKRYLIEHVEDVLIYHMNTMKTARNHMVCEAAIHALSEVVLRLDLSLIFPFQGPILETLLICLNDERWPVKDAACLASGRILRRFPPVTQVLSNETIRVELNQEIANQFLRHWKEHLVDCIWSVRENAAFACAEAIVSDNFVCSQLSRDAISIEAISQWQQLVWNMVSHFIRDNLLFALSDIDEMVSLGSAVDASTGGVSTNLQQQLRPIQSKIDSFLPRAMVDAVEKRKQQHLQSMPDLEYQLSEPHSVVMQSDSKIAEEATNYRKGWGCCVDCVNLRSPFAWEVTQGALYLFREVCLLMQLCRSSSSCDVYSTEYLCTQERSAIDKRNSLVIQSWAFQLPQRSNTFLVGLFALVELLQTEISVNRNPSSQSAVLHPIKHIEKLHPAVYEELPDIIQGLSVFSLINDPTKQGVDTHAMSLCASLIRKFWEDIMQLLTRDIMLKENESAPGHSTATSIRQARSLTQTRRLAAEKCFSRLYTHFSQSLPGERKSTRELQDQKESFIQLFLDFHKSKNGDKQEGHLVNERLTGLLSPETQKRKAGSTNTSVRRIPASSSVGATSPASPQPSPSSSSTSALITTDVMPGMVASLSSTSNAMKHNVVATTLLSDTSNTVARTHLLAAVNIDTAPSQVIPPSLYYHPAGSSFK